MNLLHKIPIIKHLALCLLVANVALAAHAQGNEGQAKNTVSADDFKSLVATVEQLKKEVADLPKPPQAVLSTKDRDLVKKAAVNSSISTAILFAMLVATVLLYIMLFSSLSNKVNKLAERIPPKIETQNPVISSVTPNEGTVVGDTKVTLEGEHFAKDAVVSIGGKEVRPRWKGPEVLEILTPRGEEGVVDINVINPASGKITKHALQFTYLPQLEIVEDPKTSSHQESCQVKLAVRGHRRETVVMIDAEPVPDVRSLWIEEKNITEFWARVKGLPAGTDFRLSVMDAGDQRIVTHNDLLTSV